MKHSETMAVDDRAAQPDFFIERDLFKNSADWVSNKGDSINKPASDFFEASDHPSESAMLVTNGSTAPWGGALVSRKRGVPAAAGKILNWLTYRFEFRFNSVNGDNIARHETDLKVCFRTRPNSTTKIRNVANFSVQWNANTGQFQIDLDPPGWVDTGFIVPEIELDVWHTLEFRFWFDDTACVFSVLSIQLDEQLYVIPEALQNVPAQNTNWERVASEQMQNEVFAAKSSSAIEYREGVLCWSSERITMIPLIAARDDGPSEFWYPWRGDGSQELLGGTFDPFGPDAMSDERRESIADLRR